MTAPASHDPGTPSQTYLRRPGQRADTPQRLAWYEVILVNSSAGKDSQAMLTELVRRADLEGVRDRLVVVHADLGRVEWTGTKALARRQAEHYGLRFESMARPQGDLLAHIEQRGKFPSATARYCTSDHKRGQVAKVITRLVGETIGAAPWGHLDRPVRVLNCLGIRAQESTARAKKTPLVLDARLTNSKRTVTTWFPIFDWTTDQVWRVIRASGVEHHAAYDHGMPRLSCVFCVFAPKSALRIAGRHNPDLLDAYVALEERIGHTFTHAMSIASVRDAIRSGAPVTVTDDDAADWCM